MSLLMAVKPTSLCNTLNLTASPRSPRTNPRAARLVNPTARIQTRIHRLIQEQGSILMPGCYDALSAAIVQQTGFSAGFISGYALSASLLGKPDFGLLTPPEMAATARSVCASAPNIPIIADADTGGGNALNVQRTVKDLIAAGAAGCFLEDQAWPKKCGHMRGKQVISAEEHAAKIASARDAIGDSDFFLVARTDARATSAKSGLEDAIARAQTLPLAGRVAIVTGSSRGIGRAIAIHLAELGARVVVNYTTKSSDAELVAAEINGLPAITGNGPRAIVVQANVSEPSQVKSLFDAAEKAFESPVHILVNSAGVLDPKYPSIANTSVEDFDRTFSVNTKGAFLCSKEAANRLKQGGGGRIILLTSSMTRGLKPGFGAYAASKAAVETMVKILAKELKGTGITANCVAPGPIATEMFFEGKSSEVVEKIAAENPFGRVGEVKDVVPLVGFLAGDGGEWINGQIIPVNGGYV